MSKGRTIFSEGKNFDLNMNFAARFNSSYALHMADFQGTSQAVTLVSVPGYTVPVHR